MVNKMLEVAYMSIEGMSETDRELLYSCVTPERCQQLKKRGNRLSADLSLAAEGLARVMICQIVKQLEKVRLTAGDCISDDFPYSGGVAGALQPKDIAIICQESGKPYQGTVPGLYFNYSHSGMMIACGVAGEEIGVDIQQVRHNILIREKVYCKDEELEDADYSNDEYFAEVWAKKESYLKMTGEGLRREMKTLNVRKMQEEGDAQWYGGKIGADYYLYACVKNKETGNFYQTDLSEVIAFIQGA